MILHPSIIALIVSSILISVLLLYSSYYGVLILKKWNIKSGSEQQLELERRTYLIATILSYVFGFQLFSLFLYVYTADSLHDLFTGAMCPAGTFNVNGYGYPTLLLKIFNFLMAGLWLILNHADSKAYDYPLIKSKYRLLIALTPFIVAEAFLQTKFFLGLKADVITSCCGSLFSAGSGGLASELASVPSIPGKIAFYAVITMTFVCGAYFYRTGRRGYLFATFCGLSFVMSVISVISFFSLYYYQLPSHHCPFDILQSGYEYIGYPLYIALFTGTVAGLGAGILMSFRNISSLREQLPLIERRLVVVALAGFLAFTFMVTYKMIFSSFKLEGY